MLLIIDNYDSFTYNIVQRIGELGAACNVVRNDKINLQQIERMRPSHIIISPGPCTPNEAGISNAVIRRFYKKVPILGICLGHQCIAAAFGGKIVRHKPAHGKTDAIQHDGKGIFSGVKNPFTATRYHSLIAERKTLPAVLEVSATNKEGIIMGLRHKEYPMLEGIQAHPESIMTKEGCRILRNFISGNIIKKAGTAMRG